MDNSGEFSDELDEFEQSADEKTMKKKGGTTFVNKPYDEAYEISQDLSMAESFDGRDKVCDDFNIFIFQLFICTHII